jgi:predicted site-specific integrase-resolvase
MERLLSIQEVSIMLGVTVKTLKIWDNEGKLKSAIRTPGGHRRYKLSDIELFMGNNVKDTTKNVHVYCRVSTKKQQDSGNLQRQKERLLQFCHEKEYNVVGIFEETASGINDNRRELLKMFRRLNEVEVIVVEYSDRLARFGFNYLKEFAKSFNVEKLEPNEEMVQDLISVVTCFSAKLYGARGGRKIKQTLEELEKERQGGHIEDNSKSKAD